MKGLYALSFIFVIIVLTQGANASLFNKNKATQLKICTVSASCATNTAVCARIGTTNECAHFRNICRFNDANCIRNNLYTNVPLTACANIAVATKGPCVGLPAVATTITTTNNKVGLFGLGGLFGNKG